MNLIPLWKYKQHKQIPEGVIRVFIGDTLFNKEDKKFYKVQQFNSQKGLIMRLNTEIREGEVRSSDIKNFVLISSREDIAKLKNE